MAVKSGKEKATASVYYLSSCDLGFDSGNHLLPQAKREPSVFLDRKEKPKAKDETRESLLFIRNLSLLEDAFAIGLGKA